MQLVHYLFAKEQIKQCTVVPDYQKISILESPAFIALRPEAPIEKQVLDLPNHLPRTQIKSLVAYLTDVVKHWWGTIQYRQKFLHPLLLDALTISVVQTVFLALILRVVFDMVRSRDFYLKRVPALLRLQGLKFNFDLAAFHLEIGWENQGRIYWVHQQNVQMGERF